MKRRMGWLGTLCVILGLAELGVRLADDPSDPDFVFDVLHADSRVASWLDRRSGGFEGDNGWISINAQGWRGTAPFSDFRRDGVGRIAVVGTGSVFGENLGDDQTWPERLEQSIGRRTDSPVEVYNYGWPGATVVYLDRVVLDEVLASQPDVVVLSFGGFNEALRADMAETQTLRPEATGLNLLRGSALFEALEHMSWRLARGSAPRGHKVPLEAFSSLLARSVSRAQDSGAQVLLVQELVIHPDIEGLWSQDDLKAYQEAVVQVALAHQVEVIDPAQIIAEADRSSLFWRDLLYGPEAAQQVAEAVAERVDRW